MGTGMQMQRLIGVLAILLLCVGCSDDNDSESESDNGSETTDQGDSQEQGDNESGDNEDSDEDIGWATMNVTGELPDGETEVVHADSSADFQFFNEGIFLQFTAQEWDKPAGRFRVQIQASDGVQELPAVGEYTIGEDGDFTGQYLSFALGWMDRVDYTAHQGQTGTLVITSVSEDEFEGTFEFDAQKDYPEEGSEVISITDGSFRAVPLSMD